MQDSLKQLEKTLDEYLVKKAPALPANIKDLIVKFAPYIVIIMVIITLPAILLLFGLGSLATVMSPMAGVRGVSGLPTMWLGILLLVPVVILQAMAIPGLFARSMKGWTYLYWAEIISVISSLVQLNIVGAIIGGLIGFYFLFQVRSHYK